MTRNKKYLPSEFARLYGPLKAQNKTQKDIADWLGISTTTLKAYLKDPDYNVQSGEVIRQKSKSIVRNGEDRTEKVLDIAYGLHFKSIKEAMERGDLEKARLIALDSLKVARTESEIRRVFNAISVTFDVKQIVLADLPEQDHRRILEQAYGELYTEVKEKGLPCPFLQWGNRPCELKGK